MAGIKLSSIVVGVGQDWRTNPVCAGVGRGCRPMVRKQTRHTAWFSTEAAKPKGFGTGPIRCLKGGLHMVEPC